MRFILALLVLPPVGAAEVKIVPAGMGFQILRAGEKYFINGAGGMRSMELLPPAGANSVRSWSPPPSADMNRAHSLGLSVMLGLPVGKPHQGIDYSNQEAVMKQREQTRALVRKYKDHPALLIRALGNESELGSAEGVRITPWKEIEQLAQIVKQEDPAHPVITVLAGTGKAHLVELAQHIPTIDAIGINNYGGMLNLPEVVAAQGWKKAWVKPGSKLTVSIKASDAGGDREPPVPVIEEAIQGSTVLAPNEPGNYRLFVYARDGKGKAATANVALRAVSDGE